MGLTKKHMMILAGLLFICLAVTLFAIWDKGQDKKIDTHVTDATKALNKQEKKQKKNLDATIGVAVPSKEEVARLLALSDNPKEHLKMLTDEYGKKYSEEIYSAYVVDKLPSNKDTAFEARVKEALLYARFNEDGYKAPVTVLDAEFIATNPFSTTEAGFTAISKNLSAGYITFSRFSLGEEKGANPEYRINMVVYADESMTVTEFESKLSKVNFVMDDIALLPFNEYVRDFFGKSLGNDTVFTTGDSKKINYLDVTITDWSKTKPNETIIYKGLPVMVSYYWTAPNSTWEELTTSTTMSAGTKTFEIYKIEDAMYLPYND